MSQSRNIRRSSVGVPRQNSRAGLIGSLALHMGIVAVTFFTWTHTLEIADQSPPVVPVDLVTIGQKTNIAPTVTEKPKVEAKEQPQPQPTPAPPTPTPPPQEQAEAAPDQATSEPKLAAPEPIPQVTPKFKPSPPKEEQPKKEKFDINNIMALLDKRAPAASSAPNAKLASRNVRGFGAQNAMTADLVDALRSQIAPCWSPPVGAPRPEQLVVDFVLFLNPDGSVAQPPQLAADSASRAAGDSYTHAAAEAARRAIYTCAPYKLPADRYSQWREINPFRFDPRQMVGQ